MTAPTDQQLANQAWTELTKTTDSYPSWVRKGRPSTSHWAATKKLLDQVGTSVTPPPPPPSPGTASLGLYEGSVNTSELTAAETWLGRTTGHVLDFVASDSWASFDSDSAWLISGWLAAGRKTIVLTVPLVCATGYLTDSAVSAALAATAAGTNDAHFKALKANLAGFDHAVVRIGHEMNGGWYNWRASPSPKNYIGAWNRAAAILRGGNTLTDWCPTVGYQQVPWESCFPGALVGICGLDAYDQAWGPNNTAVTDPATRWNNYVYGGDHGIAQYLTFAKAQGVKLLAFDEWGCAIRPGDSPQHGGGDNPSFIQNMAAVIAGNPFHHHTYWNYQAADVNSQLYPSQQFPNAKAKYKTLFG